jgi:thiol-disulfide isomerase/thioredoxin
VRLSHPYRWALGATAAVVAALTAAVATSHPAGPASTWVTVTGGVDRGGGSLVAPADRVPAPDLAGIAGWINSPPLRLPALRGKVVLVDFWTFSCVNCTRTLPHLRHLAGAYGDRGLVIIGVHSPEFDFERDPAAVAAAVGRLGVTWPVALDSAMATWNAYGNRYWPAEYLVDRRGRIAEVHVGEGDDAQIEQAVVDLLGGGATAPPASAPSAGAEGPVAGEDTTPELYAGSGRGTLGMGDAYGPPGRRVDHPDRGTPGGGDRDVITVAGGWVDRVEYLESATAGHVRLRFHARDLYVVAGSAGGAPLPFSVLLDGAAVPPATRGPDLAGGRLVVGGPDLRHVLGGVAAGDHVIDLSVPAGLRLYTFTFG